GLSRLGAMPIQQQPAAVEQRKAGPLVQALRIGRKRKWLILAMTALVTAAVAAVSLAQHKSYDATATLVFRNPSTLVDGTLAAADPAREAATAGEIVRLPGVAAVASRRLGGQPAAAQIEEMVSVDTGTGDVAKVTASASEPKQAADVANAYGQAYIDFRQAAE